jgi:tetratricopeptide (TPR) repeat protein
VNTQSNPDNFAGRPLVKGTDFSPYVKPQKKNWPLAPTAIFPLLIFFGLLALPSLRAQAPAQPKQTDPQQQKPKPPAETNPFPGDTNNVPVMPNADTAAPAPPPANAAPPVMPEDETDPVRSPDDPMPGDAGSSDSSSSNSPSMAKILEPPPDTSTKHKGNPAPEHAETAQEDESVGNFYLSDHDWNGALSRFDSALVLDPENPDVYWGLAEAQRHLGQFAAAKANYQKVMEYDPDSKHAKEAKKLLKDPEMANAAGLPAKP